MIKELIGRGALLSKGTLRHQYPALLALQGAGHLPRDAAMVRRRRQAVRGLERFDLARACARRHRATRWYPRAGENRIGAMVRDRPDWVLSRQRAWGVPIAVFVHKKSGELLRDDAVNSRIADAFEAEGADAWFNRPRRGSSASATRAITSRSPTSSMSGSTHPHTFIIKKQSTPFFFFGAGSSSGLDQYRLCSTTGTI